MATSLLEDFLSSGMFDMILGMMLGMAASPLMMRGIRVLRQKRKINKLLNEIAAARKDANAKEDIF
jgi:membrane protease subunit (stomatin/prohibitin family)